MRTLWTILLLACLPLSGCRDTPGVIPYVDVNIDLNLALPAYNSLNFPGNWLYISGGSRGLIVYRYTLDEFVVLDRHATFDVEQVANAPSPKTAIPSWIRAVTPNGTSLTAPSFKGQPQLLWSGTPQPGSRRSCLSKTDSTKKPR